MSIIAPTITAYDLHEYRVQMERVLPFAKRIHVDLMDGIFAPTKSPDLDKLWLPPGVECDIHIMYQHPHKQMAKLLRMNPSTIIVQAEANKDSVRTVIEGLKKTRIKAGVGLLAATEVHEAAEFVKRADHTLIFSGKLGYHGGTADLGLLRKVADVKALNPAAEISWDGGISPENIRALSDGGIDVLNTGGAIQHAEDPEDSYMCMCGLLA